MEKIGIFCSASENIDKMYFDAARRVGQWMGQNGKTLVYGGSNLGLMESVAQAMKEQGGHIIGVVPSIVEENGKVSACIDRIIHTNNLSDRKDILTAESDILVALPGGIGTLDEVFHVVGAASIGYHQKRVVLYNVDGFYDKLIAALDDLLVKGFSRRPLSAYCDIANSFEELTNKIQ